MSTAKNIQQNKNEAKDGKAWDEQSEENDIKVMKMILEEDPSIFLLNNLLMSIQFFENYERDVEFIRENWFKEFLLESHHKKCFYSDSLFRLSATNVKFIPRHGKNKNLQVSIHPFRIYISSDNIEAAFDPSVLGSKNLNLWPQYQFTVRTNENIEKLGYISLIEFKTIEAPVKSPKAKTPKNNFIFHDAVNSYKTPEQNYNYFHRKSAVEEKFNRRLTKTEKLINVYNRKVNFKILEKISSPKYFTSSSENINGFYKFSHSGIRLRPKIIQDFRMNSTLSNSHEIPRECFHREEVKNKFYTRRIAIGECFKSQNILNSTAFKGYFCDLLIDKLFESLSLDLKAVNESSVLEEFIIVKQQGMEYCLTPTITIRDWNKFVVINKNFQEIETKQSAWPSNQMQKIIRILPCNAVPTGCSLDVTAENEKTWKLVFPKAEEFLILHMMHAHIRCYFFVLLLYKTFIETEINSGSFGPKHLMHLLFWRVHKNFLAWPEDRPGETLINYLKILYKKLQNKFLSDFFITSRNLFADSLPRDLHKAQALIKKIIENPVFYVIKALRNLKLNDNFYPSFDALKLNTILNAENIVEKLKKNKKGKKQKSVTFLNDNEQRWKKIAMKQINLERKAEEEEQIRKESVESINLDKSFDLNTKDFDKCSQILDMFTSHFLEMTNKSIDYNYISQGLLYLNQAQKLFELNIEKGMKESNVKETRKKINQQKQVFHKKLKQDLMKTSLQTASIKTEEDSTYVGIKMEQSEKKSILKKQEHQEENQKVSFDEETKMEIDENEVFSIKL